MKKGDVVQASQSSFSFGMANGDYSNTVPIYTPLAVVALDKSTRRDCYISRNDPECICDALVTDEKGNFWFVPSRYLVPKLHTITIAGKDIEISHESYLNMKKQLT